METVSRAEHKRLTLSPESLFWVPLNGSGTDIPTGGFNQCRLQPLDLEPVETAGSRWLSGVKRLERRVTRNEPINVLPGCSSHLPAI